MNPVKSFLDDLPLATIMAIGGGLVALIAYLNNDLSAIEALGVWGVVGVGAGQIGQARNGAGRGLK